MDLRKALPDGKVSEETLQSLNPVFEAEVLFKNQRYEEAEAKYLEALENFPVSSGGRFLVYNKLGIVYEKLEKPQRAIAIYEKGIEEGSITPFSYQRLSCLHLNAGSFQDALGYCEKGIKSLKKAHTNFFQEFYFWLLLRRLRNKIKRRLTDSRRTEVTTDGNTEKYTPESG